MRYKIFMNGKMIRSLEQEMKLAEGSFKANIVVCLVLFLSLLSLSMHWMLALQVFTCLPP